VITQFPVLIAHCYFPRWSTRAENTNSTLRYPVWRGMQLWEVRALEELQVKKGGAWERHNKM